MRIFVLCTGRCGSMTFAETCKHIKNYSSAHEPPISRTYIDYPDNHIVVDNKLIWLAPTLLKKYPCTYWVHLRRSREHVFKSYSTNKGYHTIISFMQLVPFFRKQAALDNWEFSVNYYLTVVQDQIENFLKGIPSKRKSTVDIEFASTFKNFWEDINAEGNLEEALVTFSQKHNSSC